MGDRFVLVDTRTTVGNCLLFWCWDGAGYTTDLMAAARYTYEEARAQERSRPTDRAYRLSDLAPLAKMRVDHQDVPGTRTCAPTCPCKEARRG